MEFILFNFSDSIDEICLDASRSFEWFQMWFPLVSASARNDLQSLYLFKLNNFIIKQHFLTWRSSHWISMPLVHRKKSLQLGYWSYLFAKRSEGKYFFNFLLTSLSLYFSFCQWSPSHNCIQPPKRLSSWIILLVFKF